MVCCVEVTSVAKVSRIVPVTRCWIATCAPGFWLVPAVGSIVSCERFPQGSVRPFSEALQILRGASCRGMPREQRPNGKRTNVHGRIRLKFTGEIDAAFGVNVSLLHDGERDVRVLAR